MMFVSTREKAAPRIRRSASCLMWLCTSLLGVGGAAAGSAPTCSGGSALANPVLFVTQVPQPNDFATIGSVFANHEGRLSSAPRGGDLWICYPDGTLRNLTEEAGYGDEGPQRADAIAVRDPEVSWDGTKAVFSMVVGAPTQRYQQITTFWQLYEVTGLGAMDDAEIVKIPHQPTDANNVSPIYASDGRIVFVSDRSRNGAAHLYPQLDEYESTPTPTGLWSLDPGTGELFLMNHAPSGSFDPIVDSYGRVVFTRWDHLQRDQQSDGDPDGSVYGTFDYASEAADAARSSLRSEVFPEPRVGYVPAGQPWTGHRLNSFFPWQIQQDGQGEEFLNHLGRHELHDYFNRSRGDDPSLVEFIASAVDRANPNSIENFLQIREDPTQPGRYLGTDAPEFQTHASGGVVALVAPPSANPDTLPAASRDGELPFLLVGSRGGEVPGIQIEYVTDPENGSVDPPGTTSPSHSGMYRDPAPLSNGAVLVAHADTTLAAGNLGTALAPEPTYRFRLRFLEPDGDHLAAVSELTSGISESVTWWSPDDEAAYSGELWELNPVEVRPRAVPPAPSVPLPAPEANRFTETGVDLEAFKAWMRRHDLGLITVRDVTSRDDADRQQPFNLTVDLPGGTETSAPEGTMYTVKELELFQGDQVRGYGGTADPDPGRRVLARALHEAVALDANEHASAPSRIPLEADGSVAAFVPARRALAWQLIDANQDPVVFERFWITLQPGEIRACDGCHGVNHENQAGEGASTQSPEALLRVLEDWASLFVDGFESGTTTAWSP